MLGLSIGFAKQKVSPSPVYLSQSSSLLGGSNSSMTIAKPVGVISGDVLMFFFLHEGTPTITSADGFSMDVNTTLGGHRVAGGYRVAGGSEPADYTWNFSAGTLTKMGVILAYRNVNTSPLDSPLVGGLLATGASAHVMPSRNVSARANLVYAYLLDRSGTAALGTIASDPSGMTQRFFQNFSAQGRNDLGIAIYDEPRLVGGACGTRTLTTTNIDLDSIGIATALSPA